MLDLSQIHCFMHIFQHDRKNRKLCCWGQWTLQEKSENRKEKQHKPLEEEGNSFSVWEFRADITHFKILREMEKQSQAKKKKGFNIFWQISKSNVHFVKCLLWLNSTARPISVRKKGTKLIKALLNPQITGELTKFGSRERSGLTTGLLCCLMSHF